MLFVCGGGYMIRRFLATTGALALLGCGIPGYFDQHPPNVRDASAMEEDDNVPAAAPAKIAAAPVVTAPLPAPVARAPAQSVAPAPVSPVRRTMANVPVAARPAETTAKVSQAAPFASQGNPVSTPPLASPPVPASTPTVSEPLSGPVRIQATAEPATSPPSAAPALVATPAAPSPSPEVREPVTALAPPAVAAEVERSSVSAKTEQAISTPSPPTPEAQATTDSAPPIAASATAVATFDAHCEAVARARAEDAAANGRGDDLQKAVHDGTYASCIAWANAHRGGD